MTPICRHVLARTGLNDGLRLARTRASFRQDTKTAAKDVASYLRIEERELEAGGLN